MLICAKNQLHLIPDFFLQILQRYCKLVILDYLGRPGHANQDQWYQLVGKFDV